MNISSRTGQSRGRAWWPALGCAAVAGVTAVCIALPAGASSAAPAPRLASAAQSLCDKVGPSQVEAVVGWKVPGPTSTSDKETIDKKHGVHGTVVECAYTPKGTSETSLLHAVQLSYATMNKSVTTTEAEQEITSEAKGQKGKWSVKTDTSLSHPAVFLTDTSDGVTLEAVLTIDGPKMVAGVVLSKVPESTVGSLAELAASAFF
jgi:hypothetical protein